MNKHPVILAAVGCAALACLLQAVGVATSSWVKSARANLMGVTISSNFGLWRVCTPYGCGDISAAGWIMAVRAFGILAFLAMAGATVIGVLLVQEKMIDQIVAAAGLSFAGAICSVISIAIFAGNVDSGVTYGYSFALCLVAAALAGVSGGCFYAGKSKINVPRQPGFFDFLK